MGILLAIVFGLLFGFILQRIGAADPQKIMGMLQFKDLHLMKAILLGIGSSSIMLYLGMNLGLIDSGNLSVKAMYNGVIIGGLLLGMGWAIAGYCPGTGVVAFGSGRKDAGFFLLGGLVGAGIYTLMYGSLKTNLPWLFTSLAGGKVTLAINDQYDAIISMNGVIVALVLGVILIGIAALLPKKITWS